MKSIVYSLELPTWLITIAVYGGFALLTWNANILTVWILLPLGSILVCWQAHLQHEIAHGHPTRMTWFNTILALPSFWLWLPYTLYRESHLAHHDAPHLTDPISDPESYFTSLDDWQVMGSARRTLLMANQTMAGRLLIGPFLMVEEFLKLEILKLSKGDFSHVSGWVMHFIAMAGLLYWVMAVCGIPFWQYVLLFAWPGTMLALVRSYAEHWPAEDPNARTAIVRSPGFFSLLFMNNNLHVMHHERPGLAWYKIPGELHKRAAEFSAAPKFSGYSILAWRFGLRMKHQPWLSAQ